MPPTADWDAIVLAGGRGSRLGGVDKASLEFDGEPLLARTLRAVGGAERVIVAGDPRPVPDGTILVQEEPRFAGPAAAIGAAMAEVRESYVFLASCDHPYLADAVDLLLDEASGDGVIAIDGDGRRQYLMSVLDAAALGPRSPPRPLSSTSRSGPCSRRWSSWRLPSRPGQRSTSTRGTIRRKRSQKGTTMADITALDDWVVTVAAELGIKELDLDTESVLDLAAVAAHAVVRPAAPLTTFLAGLAAGMAGGSEADLRDAIETATALCERVEEEAD